MQPGALAHIERLTALLKANLDSLTVDGDAHATVTERHPNRAHRQAIEEMIAMARSGLEFAEIAERLEDRAVKVQADHILTVRRRGSPTRVAPGGCSGRCGDGEQQECPGRGA